MIQYSGILKKNFLSFKNGENDSFEKYYMLLVEIKDLNTLIDNEQFFDVPIKNKQECIKNLLKCQETIIIQKKTY